ncbi:MAG: hypothetical protein E6K37_00615, partial [Gammaproteobacteria bacterium]
MSRKAGTSAALAGTEGLLRADAPARRLPGEKLSPLESAIAAARDELIRLQRPEGSWELELEADCTIPAEYKRPEGSWELELEADCTIPAEY